MPAVVVSSCFVSDAEGLVVLVSVCVCSLSWTRVVQRGLCGSRDSITKWLKVQWSDASRCVRVWEKGVVVEERLERRERGL